MSHRFFGIARLSRRFHGRSREIASLEKALNTPDRSAAARYIEAHGTKHPDFQRFVAAGDQYRDAHHWPEGFAAYRAALDLLPLHCGYLVQAGHCLKDMGRVLAAEGYYRSGLLLGAPLDDVERHLLFVCERSRYAETSENLRLVAADVQNGNADVTRLPTLDELMGIAQVFCTSHEVDISALIGLMRSKASFDQAVETLRSRGSKPSGRLPRARHAIRPAGTFEFSLRTPLPLAPSISTIATPAQKKFPSETPEPSAPERSAAEPPSAHRPMSIDEAREIARRFVEGRLDPSTPLFFGTVPSFADPANVSLDTDSEPALSVLIVNHNTAELALLAAGSVMASNPGVPYEILIVDNGSSAPDKSLLGKSTLPFRLIDLASNTGFGEGTNIGADTARGRYLLLLNSDAFVSPGAIGEMLQALLSVEDAGVIGPVFRYPNGLLQEAGGFVCADGLTMQRGKCNRDFDTASLPRFDVVEYVSAACLLISRADFMAVGGFPPQYDLAYCEDVDLCLRVQLLHKVVMVARDATCFHVEGATTSSATIAEAAAATSQANRWALLGSWGAYLESHLSAHKPRELLPAAPAVLLASNPLRHSATAILASSPSITEAFRYVTALGGSLDGHALLASETACSSTRLRNISTWLELPFRLEGITSPAELRHHKPDLLFISGDYCAPPQELPNTGRLCLVVTSPQMLANHDNNIATRLEQFERILVPSETAKQALVAVLAARSLPSPQAIDIIAPTIPVLSATPSQVRKPTILTVTRFGEPGQRSGLFDIIDALAKTQKSVRNDWTLVACGGVHTSALAVKEITALQSAAERAGVSATFIVAPPPERLKALYRDARVFIEARGFGIAGTDDYWKCDLLGTATMRALAAGCQTLAWKVGAAAEVLRAVRSGELFGSTEELIFRLENPPPPADVETQRAVCARFADERLRERLQVLFAPR